MICALVEAINGRMTSSDRILKSVRAHADPIIAMTVKAIDKMISWLRHPTDSVAERIGEIVGDLVALGYADVGRILQAADRVLTYAQANGVPPTSLTPSELEILRLLAEGLTPKEIAARNGRSIYTVRVHIANVIAKLGCHGRSDAIRTASRMGLVSAELR